MNIAKHMESIFLAAIVLLGCTGFASASFATAKPAAPVAREGGAVAVVVVSAKRLTAAQKAAL